MIIGPSGPRTRGWAPLLALLALLAAMPAACQPEPKPEPAQPPVPTTRPTTAPAGAAPAAQLAPGAATRPAATARPALPPEALVHLDDLQPPVAAPKNPADVEALPERAAEVALDAEKRLAERDFAGAIRLFERALGFAPDNPRIHRGLGLAYAGLGNNGKAAAHLSRAIEVAPDDLRTQVMVGRLAKAAKQYDEALLRLRTARKCSGFKPEDAWAAEAMVALAEVLEEKGHWQAALDCYATVSDWLDKHGTGYLEKRHMQDLRELVLNPEVLLVARGRLLVALQHSGQAAEMLDRAFRRDRTSVDAARLLVEALVDARQFRRAEAVLVDLAAEPAQRGQLADLAGRVCLAAADKTMPSRVWKAFRQKNPAEMDAALAGVLAQTARRLGGVGEALSIIEPLTREMPGNATFALMLARLKLAQGEEASAARALAALLSANADALPEVDQVCALVAARAKAGAADRLAKLADADTSAVRPALHYVAGRVAALRDKPFVAIEQFEKAIGADRTLLPAYEALADVYLDQRQFDKATGVAQRLQQIDADHYMAYYLLGKVRLRRREVAPAIDALTQAQLQNPRHLPTRLMLVWAYERAGRAADADRVLGEAIREWRGDPRVYRRVFDRFVSRRRYSSARDLIRRGLMSEDADSIPGRIMLAELDILTGEAEKAREAYAELSASAPDDLRVELLGIRLEVRPSEGLLPWDRLMATIRRLEEIGRLDPAATQAWELLAQVLLQAGDRPGAVRALERLYNSAPEDGEAEQAYVAALALAGQHAKALEHVEALLQERPDNIWARGMALECLAEMGRFAPAIERAKQWLAEAVGPDLVFWHRYRLLTLYEKAKQYDSAHKLLDDWIASADERRQTSLRVKKVRLYMAAKAYDAAVAYGRQWAADAPEDPTPKDLMLSLLLREKQHARLVPLLQEWIGKKQDESVKPYRLGLILCLGELKKLQEARDYAAAWIKQQPYDLQPRQAILGVYADADRFADMTSLVEGWIKELEAVKTTTRPDGYAETLSWCRQALVSGLILQRQYEAALRRAGELLRQDPNDIELLGRRSGCYTELGRDAEALADLEKAYRIDPEDTGNNNNLGYMLAERGIHLEEAEQMIRKALQNRPGEVAYQDSLGWVLYKRGQLRQAAGVFHRIVGDADEDAEGLEHPVIYDHAGDAYYRIGWVPHAVRMWQKALELAKKEKHPAREERAVLSVAAEKLKAIEEKRPVKVAPLGRGVRPQDR